MIRLRTVFLMLVATVAGAGTLDFTLTSSLQYVGSGSVTFSGTLTNTGATPLYINGDNVSSALPFDDTAFLLNVPAVMSAGQTITTSLFSIILPPGTPIGLYPGTFSILGGDDASASNLLSSAPFAVQVVPEPATWMTIFAALPVAWIRRRRR
jgi:hypothetical protein